MSKLYHGSGDKFTKFDKEINWLTPSYDYAKYYALSLRDNGFIYTCESSLDNLFDLGHTGYRVYNLLPLKVPFTISQKFLDSIKSLSLSEEEITKLLEDVTSEWSLDANGYKMMCSTVARSKAFKKILQAKGYNGIKAIEYCVPTSNYAITYGLYNGSSIKIEKVEEISNSPNNSLEEAKAITWGDLDYAKKTDTRDMMGGRGTGHFGTGFYFVGANGPYGLDGDKFYDYAPERPIYEIDLDKYKLFRPRDNDTAYRIHDDMRNINNYYSNDMYEFMFDDLDVDKLEDELYSCGSEAEKVYEDLDDDFDEFDIDDLEDITNALEDDSSESQDAKDKLYDQRYRELVLEFIKKYKLENYIYTSYNTLERWLEYTKNGIIEREVKDAIHDKEKYLHYVSYAIEDLSKIFNVDKYTLLAMIKANSRLKSNETISTLIFKDLGYEGVDVTHLNKDAQGLSGLDNFSYGTVIYDLKPGTFKKIVDPRKNKRENLQEKIVKKDSKWQVQSEKGKNLGTYNTKKEAEKRLQQVHYFKHKDDLKEFLDKIDNHDGTDIYATDSAYQLKSLLEKGDKPYRIYSWKGVYYFCNALGDMTHNGMMQYLFDKGYADGKGFDEWSDNNYMVFIPKNFDVDLMTYDTSLGSDDYYYCRVYDIGVMFVRDPHTYYNSLFVALGEPEREIFYNEYDMQVEIVKNGKTTILDVRDINYDVSDAFTIKLDENLKESNESLVNVYTYQHPNVIKQLENGNTYKASLDRVSKVLKQPYSNLMKLFNLKSCPIFGCKDIYDAQYMADVSGVDYNYPLLHLQVPESEIKCLHYHDWDDYIYALDDVEGFEEQTGRKAEEVIKELEKSFVDNMDTEPKFFDYNECQIILDEIRPEWVVKKKVEEDYASKDDILAFVEKNIGTSDTPIDGPSYILPNGKFLTIWKSKIPVSKYSSSGSATHRDVQQYLYNNGLVKDDFWSCDNPDLERLGCIRVNSGFEEYIWLPDNRPNETQWNSLLTWLDWYFKFHHKLMVGFKGYAPKTYRDDDYIPDEILKKCKEAYSRGYLSEDVQIKGDEFSFTLEDLCKEYPQLVSNTYKSCGPAYIMPDGRFLLLGGNFYTHEDIVYDALMKLNGLLEFEIENEYDTGHLTELFTKFFKLIRVNDGTTEVEDRVYFVVPFNSITSSQMNSLRDFIDYILKGKYKNNRWHNIQAFVGLYYAYHEWDISNSNITSDDILSDVKFAMARGFFGESLKEDLTKEQEEYFKNSKIRDKNGNLLVCYHGTENPGFDEFDARKGKSQFGDYKFDNYNVNYFTTNKESAIGYTDIGVERGGNVYACYLNVVNPYVVNNRTEDEVEKTWRNIKDKNIRNKEIDYFKRFYDKWSHRNITKNDLNELNKDLFYFNCKFAPSEDDENYYDLISLEDNTMFGSAHPLMYYYELGEYFNKDNYEEFRDSLVGDYEGEDKEYFSYTIDKLIKWVLLMNEEEGTNYDGIIVPDIYDIGPKGSPFMSGKTTDIITLKSSNQIKRIDNLKPTSSNNINEDINKYYRLELEDCWRNRLGLFTGAFEAIPSKETIENYPEDFEDLTQEERERYYRFDELLNELSKIKSPGIDTTIQNFKEDDIFAFTSSKYNEILPIIKEMRQLLREMGFKLIVKELDIDDVNISYRDDDQVAFSKSNSSKYINESKQEIDNEVNVLRLPKEATSKMIDALKDYYPGIHLEELPIDQLVKDNDLLNDDDLQSYHQGEWNHALAKDFHIDNDKMKNIKMSNVPFVTRKKDGRLLISDGRHRTRAAYNDGYTHVEYPLYVEENLNESKQEYQKKFDARTRAHIERVNKYAKKIDREYPNHDSDKFNELYDGYSLMSKDNVTKEEQALIDDATFKHVRDNEHHCEHWVDEKDIEGFSRDNPTPHGCLDCSKMPESALEEMCCDWCAMSEEFNNTPFEWYEKNKDTRWHFNEKQDKFILDTLHKLWDNVILDESKQDIENFKQWAGEDLAWRFFKIKDRIKDNQKDVYYWINYEKKMIGQMKNHSSWKGKEDELFRYAHEATLYALESMIKEYEKTPPKKFRNKLAQSGSTKIYENNKWLVLEIKTYEASAKYGKGTQWCISASDDASQGRDDFFWHTLDEDAKMYFFIEKGGNRKYALEYIDDYNWALFDEVDTPQVGYGIPLSNALDALEDAWNPHYENSYPDLPHVKGLPDIQQAYIDYIEECELNPKDFNAK